MTASPALYSLTRHVRLAIALSFACWLVMPTGPAAAQSRDVPPPAGAGDLVFDDFEGYEAGSIPTRWRWITSKGHFPLTRDRMTERRSFLVEEESGNRFVRVSVRDFWHRIAFVNEDPAVWSLEERPCLAWEWRAIRLPEGAREDRVNDTGAAVYVYFGRDWLGRPRSIKYSYSSTLPVGTTHSFGPLKLLVVSSGADGTGDWVPIRRNVVEDYRMLFGKNAPDEPALVALWSDTDTTKDTAIADFDNVRAGACR